MSTAPEIAFHLLSELPFFARRLPATRDFAQCSVAMTALRKVEQQLGKLGPATLRRCDDYARDVLGSLRYAPWLYTYSAVHGSFREGWIPNNYFAHHIVPRLKGQYGEVDNLRVLENRLFATDAFPDIGCFVNGRFHDAQGRTIAQGDLVERLFADADSIVYKRDYSGRGNAVFTLQRQGFDPERIRALGNGVFQRLIRPHPALAEIVPGPVATMRLTTVMERNGEPSLRGGLLTVGRAGQDHLRWPGRIMVPFDTQTGVMAAHAWTQDWSRIETHPDTGVPFAGRVVPRFAECAALVVELQGRFPFAQSIGWDLTVDEQENIWILEWNGGHNGIILSQAVGGPCFAGLGWEDVWRG